MADLPNDDQLREWIEARMLAEGDGDGVQSPDELIESIDQADALLRLVRTAWPQEDSDSLKQPSSTSEKDTDLPKFGRFQIKSLLGDGGMGTVLLAHDPILQRDVALKVPNSGMVLVGEARSRFLREARAAGALRHPNIVGIYEWGEVNGICFTASEFCDGPSLCDFLKQEEEIDYRLAARIVCQLASAIAHAHHKGVIHRDLKPSNIMLEPSALASGGSPTDAIDENTFVPRITDFGLAQISESSNAEPLTKTGALFGSAGYMSPEQASGKGGVGPATDIHALGLILYEMLTGDRPFWRESFEATVVAVQSIVPKSFRSCGRDIPSELEAICFKCLEKEPANRYSTASALHDDLQTFLAIGQTTYKSGYSARIGTPSRRGPLILACLCLAIFTLIGLSVFDQTLLRTILGRRGLDYDQFQQLTYNAWRNNGANIDEVLGMLETPRKPDDNESYYLLRKIGRSAGNRLFLGHDGPVRDIAKVPHSDTFVSVGDDGTVRQWKIASGEQVQLVDRSKWVDSFGQPLNAVAISPDGEWLVTGHDTVELWNLSTGEFVKYLTRHTSAIESLAFSPEGDFVASASRDNDIRIISPETGLIGTLPGGDHGGALNESVAFSQDGKSVFALFRTARNELIRCWSCDTMEKIRDYSAPIGQFHVFAIDPTTRCLAATGDDRFLHLYQLDENRRLATSDNFEQRIRALSFSPQGTTLAGIGDNGRLHYWRTTLLAMKSSGFDPFGNADYSISAHSGNACDLEFLDENRILTCGEDGSIRLWDLAANDEWSRFNLAESPTSINVSNNGNMIAVSFGAAGFILLYDRTSGQQSKIEVGIPGAWRMSFGKEDKWIAISDSSKIISLVNCETKEIIRPNSNGTHSAELPTVMTFVGPPAELSVTSANSEQITVSWKRPKNDRVSHYRLWWRSDNQDWQSVVIDQDLTDSMSHTIELPETNTMYSFGICAFNGLARSELKEISFLVGQRHF